MQKSIRFFMMMLPAFFARVKPVSTMAKPACMRKTMAAPTRTQMVFQALDEICYEFDLEKPIWLDATVREFQIHSKARFTRDCFIEAVDFDFLEIQVIEE